jgi:hypothetical protein
LFHFENTLFAHFTLLRIEIISQAESFVRKKKLESLLQEKDSLWLHETSEVFLLADHDAFGVHPSQLLEAKFLEAQPVLVRESPPPLLDFSGSSVFN